MARGDSACLARVRRFRGWIDRGIRMAVGVSDDLLGWNLSLFLFASVLADSDDVSRRDGGRIRDRLYQHDWQSRRIGRAVPGRKSEDPGRELCSRFDAACTLATGIGGDRADRRLCAAAPSASAGKEF